MPVSQTNLAWEALLDLAATRPGPLHMRLAEAIRSAVRAGRLPLGSALPPSRTLASDLGVSRWTVTEAYGQLITEGFLSGKAGSATRVSWTPEPDERLARRAAPVPASSASSTGSTASTASAAASAARPVRYDLSQCSPDYRAFPRRKWVEAIRLAAETAPFDQLGYAEAGGEPRLRAVLTDHLNRRRGTSVDKALMSIFTGAGQSMAAICRALAAGGHRRIAVEDPGSSRLWEGARAAGLELVGVRTDRAGFVVSDLEAHPDVRAVAVGPAHQVITGVVLSPERRTQLLAWARRVDGLVIEDDYDSEFRYEGTALPALQGSDPNRVALLGSMSRTLTPTVNVGWVVAPRRWLAGVRAEPRLAATAPALTQLALAHFLESGSYDRHLRSSRQRFRARRDAALGELARLLPQCGFSGQQAGLHFLLELPPGTSARAVYAAAEKRDMALCDAGLATLDGRLALDDSIQVGYGNVPDTLVAEAMGVLAEVIVRAGREVAAS